MRAYIIKESLTVLSGIEKKLQKKPVINDSTAFCGFSSNTHCMNHPGTILQKVMASMGIEPMAFALLARRSNQLS